MRRTIIDINYADAELSLECGHSLSWVNGHSASSKSFKIGDIWDCHLCVPKPKPQFKVGQIVVFIPFDYPVRIQNIQEELDYKGRIVYDIKLSGGRTDLAIEFQLRELLPVELGN